MWSILLIVMGVAEGNYTNSSVAIETVGKYESQAVCEAVAQRLAINYRGETNIIFKKTAQCVQIKDKP